MEIQSVNGIPVNTGTCIYGKKEFHSYSKYNQITFGEKKEVRKVVLWNAKAKKVCRKAQTEITFDFSLSISVRPNSFRKSQISIICYFWASTRFGVFVTKMIFVSIFKTLQKKISIRQLK